MALKSTDLFVVQESTTKDLYKISASQLEAAIQGGAGINFRGSIDLLSPISGQIDPDPQVNGDLYIVSRDAPTIHGDFTMEPGTTEAKENDRIIWDANSAYWVLIVGGSQTGGTVVRVEGTKPITVDNDLDPTTPVVKIDAANTSDPGSVARLATAADVIHTNATPSTVAVVTADLLKATNVLVNDLDTNPRGVATLVEGGADIVANALDIDNVDNDFTIGVNNKVFTPFDFEALPDISTAP